MINNLAYTPILRYSDTPIIGILSLLTPFLPKINGQGLPSPIKLQKHLQTMRLKQASIRFKIL